jgi:cytochrome b pre-mRNA-processing protein 3
MLGFSFLRRRHERTGFVLYGAAVAAARLPVLYQALGVPDTLDGRFDCVGVHVALLIRRLRALPAQEAGRRAGPALAQAVFDAMFSDMDTTLREFGLDLGVGKRVRAMWEAFHGGALAYDGPLEAGDVGALAEALERNVWRGAAPEGAAAALAEWVMAQDAALQRADPASLLAGRAAFLGEADWRGVQAGAVRAGGGAGLVAEGAR